jgi:hypothetical protein
VANDRIRKLEMLENNMGSRYNFDKVNNDMYRKAVVSQNQRSRSEERKEKMKKIQGHLDRIKYLYKEKEYDPYYLDYVTKKKKYLDSKKSPEDNKDLNSSQASASKDTKGVNSLKTGVPSKTESTDSKAKNSSADPNKAKSPDDKSDSKNSNSDKGEKINDKSKDKGNLFFTISCQEYK